jgi:hypothetical protein
MKFATIELAALQQIAETIDAQTIRYGRKGDRVLEYKTPCNKVGTIRMVVYSGEIYRLTSMLCVPWRRLAKLGEPRPDWHMELTVLPDEVETMIPFFVAFHNAHMHKDESRLIPPPLELWHTASSLNQGKLYEHGYEWTLSAANAYDAWNDRPRP